MCVRVRDVRSTVSQSEIKCPLSLSSSFRVQQRTQQHVWPCLGATPLQHVDFVGVVHPRMWPFSRCHWCAHRVEVVCGHVHHPQRRSDLCRRMHSHCNMRGSAHTAVGCLRHLVISSTCRADNNRPISLNLLLSPCKAPRFFRWVGVPAGGCGCWPALVSAQHQPIV
jgi:hypothetical protein